MSRNKKKKKPLWAGVAEESPTPKAASVVPLRPVGSPLPAGPDSVSAGFDAVRRAIERQSYKTALEKAKELHKKLASEETKSLLIDAYIARIQGMLAKDLAAEAKALADLVASRFPEAAGRLAGLQRGLAAQMGDVAALAAPLTDPNTSPQVRAEAEQAIRKELVDLQALAACPVLPEGHPLRVAAADLARAFATVTSGDVDDTVIELAGVSHRSPLAPWKSLIRAIASLYRGEDENCRRFLATVGDDSAPARVAGAIQSVLTESWDESLTPAGRRLAERIMGSRIELRTALQTLDEAFSRGSDPQLYRQIRLAVPLCERACPEILERLKQHISVKAAVANCPVDPVVSALGGRTVHDAYFWRLFARAIEHAGGFMEACSLWDRFRIAAVEEGLFAADGPENAFLYLHMAEVLRRIGPDHLVQMQEDYLDDLDEWEEPYQDEPESLQTRARHSGTKRDPYFLFPERLYERAGALRPDADIYREWLDYTLAAERTDLKPDPIALKWAADFPEDPRPLLFLAQSAEQRDAFDKALKYIEQAERLGGIDPKVKRARFRLLVAKAERHLNQRKLDLAAKDFVQIEQLPQAADKDRPAFLLSLRWVHATMQENRAEAARLHERIRDLLGGPVAAAILLLSTARECEHASAEANELQKWLTAYKEKDVVGAIVRACQLGTDVDIETLLPAKWGSMLTKWLKRSDCELDSAGLRTVAQAALLADWPQVAYYCGGYGLQAGGPMQARFMFLRGKSLPYSLEARRQNCFAAALELARRVRDMDLVAEIADASRRTFNPFGGFNPFGPDMMDVNDLGMDEETLKKVADFERRTQKYPKGSKWPFFGSGRSPAPCQCPACRRARGEAPGRKPARRAGRDPNERTLFDDVFGDEAAEAGTDAEILNQVKDILPELVGLPPELAALMAEVTRVNGGRIPQGKRELNQIIARHPEIRRKIEGIMREGLLEDGFDPSDEPDSDEFPDIEYEPPSRPYQPRPGRSGRKKRKRRR